MMRRTGLSTPASPTTVITIKHFHCVSQTVKRSLLHFPLSCCTLDVTFNDHKCNGLKQLLIGLILSTQSAAVSFYNFWFETSSLANYSSLNFVVNEADPTSWSTEINEAGSTMLMGRRCRPAWPSQAVGSSRRGFRPASCCQLLLPVSQRLQLAVRAVNSHLPGSLRLRAKPFSSIFDVRPRMMDQWSCDGNATNAVLRTRYLYQWCVVLVTWTPIINCSSNFRSYTQISNPVLAICQRKPSGKC